MKRILEFTLCFLVVFGVVYMKPVISSHNQPQLKPDLVVEEVKVSHKSVPYYELNTTGMANFIGQTEKEFLKEFPKPKKRMTSYFGTEWLVYGDSIHDYYQVELKNHVVSSIFVIGDELDSTPFLMGMNLTDLAEITTIFSNFNFEYGDDKYEVELTEDDMNYRPLVAFNNGTFAILHMNQANGELMAVRYLDKNSLLSIMPYQMNQENHVQESLADIETDWPEVNQNNRQQLLTILNLLRHREGRDNYQIDPTLQVKSTKALEVMAKEPEKIIVEADRFEGFQEVEEKDILNHPFVLNDSEVTKLKDSLSLKEDDIHGIFYTPVLDVPFMMTNWYGSRYFHDELMYDDDKMIGVTFDKERAMTWLEPLKEEKKTTESSE